ncbi:expressed unknown protein [Seminavis robusta]|uniref:Uncharacterized protein n=1 Tax=Seminavis robusta TaxID=568900 RepID=A0A9N8HPL4_9STRA|nr:expressed unknown protein [Seminavis robusta]|eukprot:Sro1102_g241540.1 n/a (466) ;mRNA; f:9793-11190
MAKSSKVAARKATALRQKPLVGQAILLKGGTGAKRLYNKKKAFVVHYAERGCWMTVRLDQDEEACGTTNMTTDIKWRKGGFEHPPSETDPLKVLDEETLKLVFSFLLKAPNNDERGNHNVWLRNQAGSIRGHVRAVSQKWKNSIDMILSDVIGPVQVDFGNCPTHAVPTLGSMMKKHRIKIQTLNLGYASLADFPFLIELIRDCDTRHATKLIANRVNMLRVEESSWPQYTPLQARVVDLDATDNVEAVRLQHAQKELFKAIGENCPKLRELSVAVTLPANSLNYTGYIDGSLFSLASIESLEVSLGYCGKKLGLEMQVDSNVVTKLIQKLPSLRCLKLASSTREGANGWRFHIQSPSLETLVAENIPKRMWVTCACPQLQTFESSGGSYAPHGGILPVLTQDQYESMTSNAGHVLLSAGAFSFPHLSVPDTCEVKLAGDCFRKGFFTLYSNRLADIQSARFNPV